MILEIATLDIRQGQEQQFEAAFVQASPIIAGMPGHVSHQLQRGLDNPGRYVLLVNWQTLEDHTVGFRQSAQFQEWRRLLHHFYATAPAVEHFQAV